MGGAVFLRSNYGGDNEDNGDLFQKVLYMHSDGNEHAGNQHALRHPVIRRVRIGEGLEAFIRRIAVAVQVQAVVPVGPADQGQVMRPAVVHHMHEADFQMLQQRAAVVRIAVVGGRFVQDSEVAGLLDIGGRTGNQPQRVVVETAADVIVALLGQGLVLMVASAVMELRRRDAWAAGVGRRRAPKTDTSGAARA